jgi:trimethylamine--corrinoid protein Co-methyltransferase
MSDADLDDIHLATLEVLERTGVLVEGDKEALDVFADGGCRVIHRTAETGNVRIPPHVVEQAIATAPHKVIMCGLEPEHDTVLEAGRVTFTNFCEGIMVNDPDTLEHRPSTKADITAIARVVDFLDDIDVHTVAVGARDVPEAAAGINNLEAALGATAKHIGVSAVGKTETETMIKMAAVVAGGSDALRERPIFSVGGCPVSPLRLPGDFTGMTIAAARAGVPNTILTMAMAGGSAPVSLAGALVTHNCEILAGVVLAQLTERGSPVVYSSSSTAMDLRLGACTVGTPELALFSAAVAQIARRYNLPSFVAGL